MTDLFPSRVKICGITNLDDALAASRSGARTLGFVFHPPSPRSISPEQARDIIRGLPEGMVTIGVFVNRSPQEVGATARICGLSAVQLHGEEPDEWLGEIGVPAIKAFRVRIAADLDGLGRFPSASAYLLDAWSSRAAGGTGEPWDWALGREIPQLDKPLVLAGGLSPDNVTVAIRRIRPAAVDVSSGVEASPGIKDHDKIDLFITRVQEAFDELGRN